MDKKELNRRAAIVALADPEGDLPKEVETFDPINNRDDLLKLLISTQISFTRGADGITAEAPFNETVTEPVCGSEIDAAALAAVKLAASWAPAVKLT
ncbi:hypothetical protein PQR37_25980 [Paraburkholderia nemoris]|uniref:hypothetical protein n=1 Tax=Paraburkholderia nemoris TaxID=2793076 RepID=UPI0038BC4DA5